ncbi:hypothetical protein AGMMS49959_07080 [Planctomycetales bacterium]|nr:hypothetical protein AGMMS49959_07080 [Planctomycetales bacterium]
MIVHSQFDGEPFRRLLGNLLWLAFVSSDIEDAPADTPAEHSVYLNPAAADYFPVGDELEKMSLREVLMFSLYPRDATRLVDVLRDARAGRTMYELDCRLLNHATGEYRWVWLTGEYRYNAAGQATHLTGLILDIDDRRRPLEILYQSHAQYQLISERVTDYIYTVRLDHGKTVETTHGEGVHKITGYDAEDFKRDPYLWITMVHERDRDAVVERSNKIMSGDLKDEDLLPFEHRLRCKNGKIRWVSSIIVPHRDEHGEIDYYNGVVRDITAQKQDEENSRQRQYINEILLSSVPFASVLIMEDGEIIDANAHGKDLGFMPGDNALTILDRGVLEGNFDFGKMFPAVIKSGSLRRFDLSFHERIYETTFVPMQPDLLLICFYDIVRRR